jgi:hypothetical protein
MAFGDRLEILFFSREGIIYFKRHIVKLERRNLKIRNRIILLQLKYTTTAKAGGICGGL